MGAVGCRVGVLGRGFKGLWLSRVKGMYCKGLRQGAEVRIGPSPYRSNMKCLTYVVIILKLPVVSYSFELQKVRKTKLSLPQMKNYQNPFEQ